MPSEVDPLTGFDWSSLYSRYDAMCSAFRADSVHLSAIQRRVATDRQLYYRLVEELSWTPQHRPSLDGSAYEALLYWKLYSQPAALSNLKSRFSGERSRDIARRLDRMLRELPSTLSRDWSDIRCALKVMNDAAIFGIKSCTALPVRTTVLHFLYPSTVPIFDRMVLKAVGMWSERANEKLKVLERYLPVAWRLADAYEPMLTGLRETPVRLVDMALWVTRGAR